jgi:hypothetical protein
MISPAHQLCIASAIKMRIKLAVQVARSMEYVHTGFDGKP